MDNFVRHYFSICSWVRNISNPYFTTSAEFLKTVYREGSGKPNQTTLRPNNTPVKNSIQALNDLQLGHHLQKNLSRRYAGAALPTRYWSSQEASPIPARSLTIWLVPSIAIGKSSRTSPQPGQRFYFLLDVAPKYSKYPKAGEHGYFAIRPGYLPTHLSIFHELLEDGDIIRALPDYLVLGGNKKS